MRSNVMAVIALVALVACGSRGCSCAQPIKGGFPVAARRPNAIQVRATAALFQFFSAEGPKILPGLIPGGSTFNVPPQCNAAGGTKICCATPAPMCRINFDFKRVALTPTAPDILALDTDFQLKTLDNLPAQVIGGTCMISIDTTRSGAATMNLKANIHLTVNATTDLTEVSLTDQKVTGLDAGDIKDDEPGSTPFLCAGLNFLNGLIAGILESQVQSQLADAVSGQTCMICMDKSDCNSYASDCKSNQCVDSTGKCIQELGLESKMDVGGALASFAPGTRAFLDVLAVAGHYSHADSGLSLGVIGGALGDPHSPCVPMVPAPSPAPPAESQTFKTDFLPDGATPYHLGIGVHRSHLDTIGWGVFDSGGLCLHVGTPSVALLSTKTLQLIIPSLQDLVHVGDAPAYLALKPARPPTFSLGRGTFKVDDKGQKTVDDALIHVAVPDFAIDFYVFVDDRYVRVLTLTADLNLGVSLDVDGMGQLVPLLGDLGSAFTNLRISNYELLSDSPEDLKKAFPMLLGLAVGQLGGALKPIALPALMGLNLKPLAVTSTDPDAHGAPQLLSIFADRSGATPELLGADTTAKLVRLELPPTYAFAVAERTSVVPKATLELGGRSVAGRALEYSWSVDGGVWSPFSTATRIEVTDPILWLQGRHQVRVRARAEGLPDTLDLSPAEVELLVDTVAPAGSVEVRGGEWILQASDAVSPASALQFRVRSDAGAGEWSHDTRVAAVAGAVVEVRDEAGNIGELEFHGRSTAPPSSGGCGCVVGGRSEGDFGLGLGLALCLGLGLWRRRWLLVLLLGCNDPGLQKGDFEAPEHEIGRYHDAVARNGVFHVSAYDDSTGDLAYARISDLTKPIGWQYVDGLDPTAPPDVKGGYRHGVADNGPDVGLYSSIALTRAGEPRIAYYDATNGALKLALGPHPWRTITVEAGDGSSKVGLYTALTLDDKDLPTIAYMATNLAAGGAFSSEVRVATALVANPGEKDWKITTVAKSAIRCAGLCATGQACLMDAMVGGMPNGDPVHSTCTPVDSNCNPACATGEACLKGACVKTVVPVKGDLPEGIGLFLQARRSATGALTLVYYDRVEGDLYLATQAAGLFTPTRLDGGSDTADVGQFASAQLDAAGTLHVAYVDAIADQLKYVAVMAGTPGTPEVVDDGVRDDGPHSVGAGAALFLDGNSPRVVYQDQVLSDLWQAKRDSGWSHAPLKAGAVGYGWWPHVLSDGGKRYLTQFVYDRGAGQPAGLFTIEPLP